MVQKLYSLLEFIETTLDTDHLIGHLLVSVQSMAFGEVLAFSEEM